MHLESFQLVSVLARRKKEKEKRKLVSAIQLLHVLKT
jgi:hypothetical protein